MTDKPLYELMHDADLNTTTPVYDHTRAQRIALLHKALDWLDANPDKHIAGTLAEDGEGNTVEPDAPEAQCWCVLGRMVVEGNLEPATIFATDTDETDKNFYPTLDQYTKPFTEQNTCSVIFAMADAWSALGPTQMKRNRDDLRIRFPLEPAE